MTSNEELTDLYGPAATHSEHRRSDHITYQENRETRSGEILWVAAPTTLPGGLQVGIRYIVAPDVPTGFIDVVYPGDVVTSPQETQEPVLVLCPYCPGPGKVYHYEGQVCPNNPNRQP